MEDDRGAIKILTGKPTINIHLGRPKHRWENNIRIDLKEIGVSMCNETRQIEQLREKLKEFHLYPPQIQLKIHMD